MENIYKEVREAVKNGSRFSVNFQTRSLRVDGKFIIQNGEHEGELGVYHMDTADLIEVADMLYQVYKHSRPSERSESRRKKYFKALPENELTEDDMFYGETREYARCELELYLLLNFINGSFNWDDIDKEQSKWFWQSQQDKDFIILKSWVVSNK